MDTTIEPERKGIMKALFSRLAAASARVRVTVGVLFVLLILNLVLFFWWNNEPELFDVRAEALARVGGDEARLWPGVVTTATLSKTVDTLLNKSGGYLSNDVVPPSVFMDDIPNWEFGIVNQVRDLAKSLRNDMSRSRTQSTEDPSLQIAEPHFNYQNDAWLLPSSESEYGAGREALELYLTRLLDANNQAAQFYARADNLSDYLDLVEKRLGSLSTRLSASIAQERVNVDIGGAVRAESSTDERSAINVKTPWMEIDDVFYEARGSAWALILFLPRHRDRLRAGAPRQERGGPHAAGDPRTRRHTGDCLEPNDPEWQRLRLRREPFAVDGELPRPRQCGGARPAAAS